MFKILAWNIRHGGGNRVDGIVSCIHKHKAHVVVLSEFRNNKQGDLIRTRLLMQGFKHQFVTAAAPEINSVLIASKLHANSQLFRQDLGLFPDAIIGLEFEAFNLYGMYLPHKKKHHLFDFLVRKAAEQTPAIMLGDFNTGKNFIDQNGSTFWYTDKLEELEALNFHDAFRVLHPDRKEFSWFSAQGNGYRYDHCYIHDALTPLLSACFYDQEPRISSVSDHALMVLELG